MKTYKVSYWFDGISPTECLDKDTEDPICIYGDAEFSQNVLSKISTFPEESLLAALSVCWDGDLDHPELFSKYEVQKIGIGWVCNDGSIIQYRKVNIEVEVELSQEPSSEYELQNTLNDLFHAIYITAEIDAYKLILMNWEGQSADLIE